MSFFLLLNTKEDIFKTVGKQTVDGSHWLLYGKKIPWTSMVTVNCFFTNSLKNFFFVFNRRKKLSIYLLFYRSICHSIYLLFYLLFYHSKVLQFNLSIYLSIHLSICPSIYYLIVYSNGLKVLSSCLFVYLFHLFVLYRSFVLYHSIYFCIFLSIIISIVVSVYLYQ